MVLKMLQIGDIENRIALAKTLETKIVHILYFFFRGVPERVSPADYSPPSTTCWQQGSNQGPESPSSATSTTRPIPGGLKLYIYYTLTTRFTFAKTLRSKTVQRLNNKE